MTTTDHPTPDDDGAEPRQDRASSRRPAVVGGAIAATALLALGGYVVLRDTGDAGPAATPTAGGGDPAMRVVVHRSPTCGCCEDYVDYLRRHGYAVESEVTDDVAAVKDANGVVDDARSCHTALIGDYAVEGHVPIEAIDRLLDEQPALDAIALAGMPSNSPGMGEPTGEPLEVVAVTGGDVEPYMTVER